MIIVLARRSSPSRSSLLFSRPKVTDSFILDSLFPPLLELLFGLLLVFTVNRPLCNCRGQGGIDNYKLLRLSGRLFFFRLYFYLLFSSLFAFRKDRANRSIFLPFPSFDRESGDFYFSFISNLCEEMFLGCWILESRVFADENERW